MIFLRKNCKIVLFYGFGGIMRLKINSCGICDCLPEWGWQTAKNGFSDYDLWAVFRGEGALLPHIGEEKEISVHEGICILLAPNVCYTAHHDPKRPLLVINVHFDILDEQGKQVYPVGIEAKTIAFPSFFEELLTRVVSLYNSNREDAACRYLACALEEFFSSDTPDESQNFGPWIRIADEICTAIDKETEIPTLAVFAARYGYTERYMGKMFRKVKGVSFSEYLQNSRIGRAKTLLRLTELPVREIAEELGFYDACHFTRAFRKSVGVAPLAYRKQK